jgi:hypothetical protein
MWEQFCADCSWIWQRCRHRFRSALALSLAFKAHNLMLLTSLAAVILRVCLALWGRASVGNFELAAFFLSPEAGRRLSDGQGEPGDAGTCRSRGAARRIDPCLDRE